MPTILIPLDGSALAEQTLPYVQLLAPLLAARVHLLRVVAHADIDRLRTSGVAAQREVGGPVLTGWERARLLQDVLCRHAEDYLVGHARRLCAADLEVTVEVRVGPPEATILEVARAERVSLIALSTHGYCGLIRRTMSSVTSRIVRAASAPVLIVRSATITALADSEPLILRRLLVPLSASAVDEQALTFAVDMAARARAEITLLHADPSAAHDTSLLYQQRLRTAEQILDRAAEIGRQHQVQVSVARASGVLDQAIAEEAARHKVDMIVMAIHCRHRLRRWLFGSLADDVLHLATVPILAIPVQGKPL